jgi:hypothetical protein
MARLDRATQQAGIGALFIQPLWKRLRHGHFLVKVFPFRILGLNQVKLPLRLLARM